VVYHIIEGKKFLIFSVTLVFSSNSRTEIDKKIIKNGIIAMKFKLDLTSLKNLFFCCERNIFPK